MACTNGAYGSGGWTSGGENFVFLAAGFAATNHPSCGGCPGPHLEVKNTVNGSSSLQVTSISTYENINIRIARVGNAVIVLYQLPGESWEVRERYDRGDFPDEVQIGFVTYTDWQKVSIVNGATDAELLSFLGYDTEVFCPMEIEVLDTIVDGQIVELSTSDLIIAENLIQPNSTVIYSSINSVELLSGFECETGADFTVDLNGCN